MNFRLGGTACKPFSHVAAAAKPSAHSAWDEHIVTPPQTTQGLWDKRQQEALFSTGKLGKSAHKTSHDIRTSNRINDELQNLETGNSILKSRMHSWLNAGSIYTADCILYTPGKQLPSSHTNSFPRRNGFTKFRASQWKLVITAISSKYHGV